MVITSLIPKWAKEEDCFIAATITNMAEQKMDKRSPTLKPIQEIAFVH
jgi:hypothetical protein